MFITASSSKLRLQRLHKTLNSISTRRFKASMQKEEGYFTIDDGSSIAYQRWGKGSDKKILALHGWLDNSNSFSFIGPLLASRGCDVIAIDHIGHGLSSKLNSDCMYHFAQYVYHIKKILELLGWTSPTLIGHSMGAIMSTLFSGAFPEITEKLILIEGLAPITNTPNEAAQNLRRAIDAESKARAKGFYNGVPNSHPNIEAAAKARLAVVATYTGKQYLSIEAARALVERGTRSWSTRPSIENSSETVENDSRVYFVHDPRHLLPPYYRLTPEQAASFVGAITAPTLLISAECGWPFNAKDTAMYLELLNQKNLLTHHRLPGSHHLHMDPNDRDAVAQLIASYLELE